MVNAAWHDAAIAALEADIPDVGALIFATLGIALALHGKRALRPRALNAACIGISLGMNALAAGHGWRDLAIWVMPAGVYALASDTLIGVVRAWVLALQQASGQALADDGPTLLALAGGTALWLLRLLLDPLSTLAGFRTWVIEECPVAPGRRAGLPASAAEDTPALPAAGPPAGDRARRAGPGQAGKQDQLIARAGERYDLARIDPGTLAPIARQIAAEVDLHPGTARRVLRAHVLTLQASAGPARARDAAPGDEQAGPGDEQEGASE